jgi:hypothetical protein
VKDLMQGIKHLLVKTRAGKPLALRLRGQWENVDPREWKTQWDMTVNVGLGTNDKRRRPRNWQQVMVTQKLVREMGFPHLVHDVNVYNAAKRMQETAGYKQEGEFFTPPGAAATRRRTQPPEEPPEAQSVAHKADRTKPSPESARSLTARFEMKMARPQFRKRRIGTRRNGNLRRTKMEMHQARRLATGIAARRTDRSLSPTRRRPTLFRGSATCPTRAGSCAWSRASRP